MRKWRGYAIGPLGVYDELSNARPSHPVLRTLHSRQAGVQKRLVLEEVQVTPRLLGGVVGRAVPSAAPGALEPPAPLEVHMEVEPPLLGAELHLPHHPGALQPERLLKQVDVPHVASSCPSPPGQDFPRPREGNRGGRPSRGSVASLGHPPPIARRSQGRQTSHGRNPILIVHPSRTAKSR
jgi:hypothetical protein